MTDRTDDFETMPRTPEELHAWIAAQLGLGLAMLPLIPGHAAPFDYIVHAFFEGRFARKHAPLGDSEGPATSGAPAPPVWEQTPGAPADCVVWAARGAGKTFLGALATLLDMVFKPGIEIRVLGDSMDQSRRMHAHLRRLLDPRRNEALSALVDGNITERRLRFTNASEVELLAQSQASVRGTRVQRLRCDEVELFDRDVWDAAQLVTRSKAIRLPDGTTFEASGSIECLSTMHVPHGLMHELVAQAGEGRRAMFKWGVVDVLDRCGPAHECETCSLRPECEGKAKARDAAGLSAGHVRVSDALTMKSRVSQATWNAEMLCLYPTRTDAVIPEFDARLHVFSHEVPEEPAECIGANSAAGTPGWCCGMDFGYRSPAPILWARLDGEGVLWIVDERAEPGQLVATHARAIVEGRARRSARSWPRPEWIGVDPAGRNRSEQTGLNNIQVLQAAGLVVRAKQLDRAHGLELIRARLRPAGGDGRPRLYVHARCTTLIESLEKYHYPPDRPYSMEPVKDGSDHAVDALRYLIQNLDRPVRSTLKKYANV